MRFRFRHIKGIKKKRYEKLTAPFDEEDKLIAFLASIDDAVKPRDFEQEDDYEADDEEYEDFEQEGDLELELEAEIVAEV